jgi:butyryl-CoA dehydrogenase
MSETIQTNLDLTETEAMIRDTVRKFAREEVAKTAEEVDAESRFPIEHFRKMTELGLMGIPIPEEYGGGGFGTLSYVLAVEELAKVCGSTALSFAAHTSLGTTPIFAFGNEAQRKRWVPDLASGRKLGAFGLTEPGSGSDAAGIKTVARKDGKHYVLEGRKCFITNANYAETFVITAITDKSKGPSGISAFVVEKGTPGFSVEKGEESSAPSKPFTAATKNSSR